MSLSQAVGLILLAIPFIALGIVMIKIHGSLATLAVFGISALILAIISLGVHLIISGC